MDEPLTAPLAQAREPSGASSPSRRPLAAPWQCGSRRLTLRRRFNDKELDAARILEKYDKDSNGLLNVGELKVLLQDYSEGELVSQADVDYIMRVADVDHDNGISKGELLHGLKAWYALKNLPKAVDLALQERSLSEGALPTMEAMRELLQEVNESQPVALEEAEQVRSAALALGATEELATADQLRGAVADWYLQIEREDSTAGQLGKKSVQSSVRRLSALAKGEFEVTTHTMVAGGVLLALVGILLPVLEILVAQGQDVHMTLYCEHPDMYATLRTTGCLTLGLSTSVVVACVAAVLDVNLVKMLFGGLAGILLIVISTMEVYGILHVSSSTSARCGLGLWTTCYFVYCVFPLCTVVFLFFGLPCLLMKEYFRHRAIDRGLTRSSRRPRSPHLAQSMDVAVEKLREAEQWQSGAQRLALRKKFNTQEIDAVKIIRRYDKDGSGVLEAEELQQLLRDYNGRQPVSPEDLDYVMMVSDLDRDDTISKDEVMYGLRVWYAFRNMPKEVGLAFTKHQIHDGPLPPVEDLGKLLTTLNESQPVTEEEATYVRRVCLALGGSEEHITAAQLRRAVATWYLHIKRPETSKVDLMRKSFSDVQHRVTNVREHAKRLYRGDVDYHAMSSLMFLGILVFVALLQPLLDLLVATGFPSPAMCEYPELSSKLWWTGVMTLVVTIAAMGFALVAASTKISFTVKRVVGIVFGALLVILLSMEVFGLLYSISSTAARCGAVLWTFCHFTYVVVPVLTLAVLCCGMPCLFFVEYFDNEAVDDGLGGVEGQAQA